MRSYKECVRALNQVISHGHSLDVRSLDPLDREISFGTLRHYGRLDAILERLIDKPLAEKHNDIYCLLLAGLYSVDELNRPPHASVDACVTTALHLKKKWAKGLVNAVLRNYLRKKDALLEAVKDDPVARWGHPLWMIEKIQNNWPDQAETILNNNQERPPMTLRVNLQRTSREQYLERLTDAGLAATAGNLSLTALTLESPSDVIKLPGFETGDISVQDEASQLAAFILNPQSGDRILDACAAPGGKTCHLLEMCSEIKLVANDIDATRTDIIRDNLKRLNLNCVVSAEAVAEIGGEFDKILLDAPCSATGIIRRHPDIKLLRRNEDIDKLAIVQRSLLEASWRQLVPGGELLYSTCSIMTEENEKVISDFVGSTADAEVLPLAIATGIRTKHGHQLLPGPTDGFYFAHLRKAAQVALT